MSLTQSMEATHEGRHNQPAMMIMCQPMTSFVDMLRMQPELQRVLKLPPWLHFRPYARKNEANLTATERQRFLCALDVLISNGTFGQIVDIHADASHQMHGTQRFLPWHRIYLLILEQALQAIHPDVSIPYWDWTKAKGQTFPAWLAGVTPTVVTPTRTITVTRFPQSSASLATLASNIPSIMALTTFSDFTSQLEGVHGGVHVWVGGTMSGIPTAPADPIFWLHHCNIDRLWWKWQTSAVGSGKNPSLSGASAVMDPWTYTEADTRDITTLGFTYV